MRVLHVVSHFPPDRVGGVGEVAAHVHRSLVDRGHDSHVLTTGVTQDDPAVRRVCERPGSAFVRRSIAFADWAAGFDIVHFHHGEALPLLAHLRRREVRTLLTLHVDNRSIARSEMPVRVDGVRVGSWGRAVRHGLVLGGAKVALDVAARRLADRTTFISSFGAREIAGRATDDTVIRNGVLVPDPPTLPPTRRGGLLYVGTAGARKRTALLPGVVARVREAVPGVRMAVVGFEAGTQPDLLDAIDRHGVADAFEFVGPVRSEDLGPYYRSAEALVIPSRYEGLPMVALEAMSHGTPVITTRAGGVEEAVTDRIEGRVVDVDDVDGLAQAGVEILTDPAGARAMGERARRRVVEQFGIDRQIHLYLDLYAHMAGA